MKSWEARVFGRTCIFTGLDMLSGPFGIDRPPLKLFFKTIRPPSRSVECLALNFSSGRAEGEGAPGFFGWGVGGQWSTPPFDFFWEGDVKDPGIIFPIIDTRPNAQKIWRLLRYALTGIVDVLGDGTLPSEAPTRRPSDPHQGVGKLASFGCP